MNIHERWRIISRRILSLHEAGKLYGLFQCSNTTDGGAADYLNQQVLSIFDDLKKFRADFASVLAPDVIAIFDTFFPNQGARIAQQREVKEARAGLVFLVALESQITALLSDTREVIRTRTERAILQLKWQLIVDDDVRAKWDRAYNAGEPKCEQLGAAHLIGHGICAIKVRAGHSETDLILREPLDQIANNPAIDGFVPTEWKRVTDKDVATQLQQARDQLTLYKEGALSSMTLLDTRYVIAVSLTPLKNTITDVVEQGVTFRQVNLVINSPNPSKEVKNRPLRA